MTKSTVSWGYTGRIYASITRRKFGTLHVPTPLKPTEDEAASEGKKPVLKLLKNIYGLKQAGRLWHQMLDKKLRELNYKQSSVDMCLYYKIKEDTQVLVGIYDDDLLVTSNNVKLIDEFFEGMKTDF
jgi:hypothetical protein